MIFSILHDTLVDGTILSFSNIIIVYQRNNISTEVEFGKKISKATVIDEPHSYIEFNNFSCLLKVIVTISGP